MSQANIPVPQSRPRPRTGTRPESQRRPPAFLNEARAPWAVACELAFPVHRYDQKALSEYLGRRWKSHPRALSMLRQFQAAVGVQERCLALPIEEYEALTDFGKANDAFIRVGTDLAAQAVTEAAKAAGVGLSDIDAIFFTTVTGVAAPTIDARLINRLGLRRDIRRTPMFGLGCLGGAAGLSRASDYLRAFPRHVAVLLSVELCSLTLQDEFDAASVIAANLFADAAAAVVLVGEDYHRASSTALGERDEGPLPRVVDTRSAFFYDTERVMGWDVGRTGFKVVLSADVPKIAEEKLPPEIDAFLAQHRLTRGDIRHWVCHPGGPKVIRAIEDAFDLPPDALAITRSSLASVGNLSSASVLHVLQQTQVRAQRGDLGLLLAMGPGFCAELVLLAWR